MSSLMHHYYLQVVFPMSLLCRAFVQRMLSPASVSILTFSMSPVYPNSVSMTFVPQLISSFWFGTHVGWCGMHQCPPSDSVAPSTLAPYLGLRLETYIVPWSLQSLVAGFSSLSTVGLHYCLIIDRFYKWLDFNKYIRPCLECTSGTLMLIFIIDELSCIG